MPYLPKLMEHMLTILRTAPTTRPKELAISAIGATGKIDGMHVVNHTRTVPIILPFTLIQ